MANDIIFVLCLLIVTVTLSGISSDFRQIPVDILHASNGLIVSLSFRMDRYLTTDPPPETYGANIPDTEPYIIFIVISQLFIGFISLRGQIWARSMSIGEGITRNLLYKTALYSLSLFSSLFSYYTISVLFMNTTHIFKKIMGDEAELVIIANRFLEVSPVNAVGILIAPPIIIILSFIIIKINQQRI